MTIITSKIRESDGQLVQVHDGGSETTLNKAPLRPMTEDEIMAAALSDPDAQPLTDETLGVRRRVPQARVIRRALHLTQEEFASRYHIPVGTLRDWEQGRSEPDQPARAYLRAIAGAPEAVRRALEVRSA
jgi:putative transcriptional regulator